MINALQGWNTPGILSDSVAGIHITIIFRKATASDIETKTVPFTEKLTHCLEINYILIDLSWSHQFGCKKGFTVASSNNSIASDVISFAIGINIH